MPQNPGYGSRLMPHVLDDIAQHHDRTFAVTFLSGNQGYQEVKFSAVARAVNWLAFHLQSLLGKGDGGRETIAYLGISDLRYTIVFLAGVKCGYKVLLPSPRNPAKTNGLLFDATACSKLLHSSELQAKVEEIQSLWPDVKAFSIPSLSELLEKTSEPFPYRGRYEDRKWEPILVLHSSGSTGTPKPIVMNHATFAVADHDRLLPPVPGRKTQNYAMWDFSDGGYFYSPFPPFHLAGFTAMVALPIYAESTSIVLGPSDRPPAPDLAISIMKTLPIKALFCPPSIAEGIARDSEALVLAKRLKFLLYAGGPLSEAAGSVLSKLTDVCQFYGQTETGPMQSLVPQSEDWAWLEWHPAQEVRMQAYADDLFEMVMDRNPALEKIRSISCNFPNEEVWHTKDLFRKHATRDLWQFAGRTDDIIVLSSGEKYNPVPAEVALGSIPGIKGALIVGHGRFSPALLLEVSPDASHKSIADFWQEIEVVNQTAPEFGRISRSLVLIASANKPFERAGKGTIIRAATERLLGSDIEELYTKQSIETKDVPQLSAPVTEASLRQAILDCVSSVSSGKQIDENADLFSSGFDSLQTLELANLLKHSLKLAVNGYGLTWLNPVLIYNNSTQAMLAQVLWKKLNNQQHESVNSVNRTEQMEWVIDREISLMDQLKMHSTPHSIPLKQTVILTGATGSLGRYILQVLVQDTSIDKVYCLVRKIDAAHDVLHEDLNGLSGADKVVFLRTNLGEPRLGLSSDKYTLLMQTATTIIHSAWAVNFNQELTSFENPWIFSLKYMFELLSGEKNTHFIFISSLSTIGQWKTIEPEKPVPEIYVSDPTVVTPTGYAESKYVVESLCQYVATNFNIRSSVLRAGQIANSTEASALRTAWKDREWFPILLKTSKSLRKIPDGLAPVDWLPADLLANLIHDLMTQAPSKDEASSHYYNVVNPHTVPFKDFIPSIQSALGSDLEVISLQAWIDELEKMDQENPENIKLYPAIKILEFFRRQLTFDPLHYDFTELRKASPAFREVKPIDGDSVVRWIRDMDI